MASLCVADEGRSLCNLNTSNYVSVREAVFSLVIAVRGICYMACFIPVRLPQQLALY